MTLSGGGMAVSARWRARSSRSESGVDRRVRQGRPVTPVMGLVVGVVLISSAVGASGLQLANATQPLSQVTTPPFKTGCQLVDPPVLAPANLGQPGHHTLDVNLDAVHATVNVSGKLVDTHVYNPSSTVSVDRRCTAGVPGGKVWVPPTLHVNPGDQIRVKLSNNQTDTGWDTNLHYHGLHVSPGFNSNGTAADNVFLNVPPTATQQYQLDIPNNHPIGTYWYHGHSMPEEPQLLGGEAGLIQIGDVTSQLPTRLRSITSHTLMLKDMQLTPGTNQVITSGILSGAPTTRLVNDMLHPYLTMAVNETQHWSLANTSTDIYYDVQLDHHVFSVIGEDGNPVWRVDNVSHLLMPPAKRFDVLVQSTGHEAVGSSSTLRTLQYSQGTVGDVYPNVALATVRFTSPKQRHLDRLPVTMPGAQPITGAVTNHETVYFNEDPVNNTFAISTKPEVQQTETPLPISVVVPPGRNDVTGEWTIANTALENHVFHIHINPLQIVAMSDPNAACPNAVVPYHATGLIDTFNLPQAQTTATPVQCAGDPAPTTLHYGRVIFRTTWKDFFGRYVGDPQGRIMLHCHILAHLDNGMMTWFEVIKPQ
jgi:suppressor of ftsI